MTHTTRAWLTATTSSFEYVSSAYVDQLQDNTHTRHGRSTMNANDVLGACGGAPTHCYMPREMDSGGGGGDGRGLNAVLDKPHSAYATAEIGRTQQLFRVTKG